MASLNETKSMRYGSYDSTWKKVTNDDVPYGYRLALDNWTRDGGIADEFDQYEKKYANRNGTYQDYWDSVSFGNVVARAREDAKVAQIRKNDQAREDLMYRQQKASEGQSTLLTSGNDRSQSGQGATLISGKEGVMLSDANKKRKTLLGA